MQEETPGAGEDDVVSPIAAYYAGKLAAHGQTAQGVDWNSQESQQLRFAQLLRLLPESGALGTVLDYGCGYGALAQRLIEHGEDFRYIGFDVCTPMIEAARAAIDDRRCAFTEREDELPTTVDYTLASGIFNVRLDAGEERWETYVERTLATLAARSRRGFAFNMLTRYADRERMRDHLYYADPGRCFRLCKERWSRDVALLHDYELYEFTVLVRLGSEPKPLCA